MTVKPSNIKDHGWYENFIKLTDKIIYSNEINTINEQELPLKERINHLRIDDENVKEVSKYDIPIKITLIEGYNTLEKNEEFLEKCKVDMKELLQLIKKYYDVDPDIKKLDTYSIGNYDRCLLHTKSKIEECEKALKKGYLITNQLVFIAFEIESYWYDLYKSDDINYTLKIHDIKRDVEGNNGEDNDTNNHLMSFTFEYPEDNIIEILKQEKQWRNKDRDVNIYKERQKGRLLKDVAEDHDNLNVSAISRITKKVECSIGYYRGKLFESEFYKYLKNTGGFDKVEWDGKSGRPDIVAHDLGNNDLHIYSLKTRKINKSPFYILVDEMRPELKVALESLLEGYHQIYLWLIVHDCVLNETKKFQVDFRHPKNIDISS